MSCAVNWVLPASTAALDPAMYPRPPPSVASAAAAAATAAAGLVALVGTERAAAAVAGPHGCCRLPSNPPTAAPATAVGGDACIGAGSFHVPGIVGGGFWYGE